MFLSEGQILSTRGRHPDSNRDYVADGADIAADLPLVILIDGVSASAAEIVAAVLQDRQRAVVIGSSSYGKGTIQTMVPLANGCELSITWSQAVPAGGGVLTGRGVTPVVCTSGPSGLTSRIAIPGVRPRSGGTAPSIWKSPAA